MVEVNFTAEKITVEDNYHSGVRVVAEVDVDGFLEEVLGNVGMGNIVQAINIPDFLDNAGIEEVLEHMDIDDIRKFLKENE